MRVLIYFEPSALFKTYIPESGTQNVEWALSILGDKVLGVTSRWTLLEIVRGFVKRRNLGEIPSEDLEDIIEFFLRDIEKMLMENKIMIVDVSKKIVDKAIGLIKSHNLYAADAVHVATAEISGARAILVDDFHYERIKGSARIEVINVEINTEQFKKTLGKTISKS